MEKAPVGKARVALGDATHTVRKRTAPSCRLPISDEARVRITACTDLDRLNDWLDRAGTVERAEELFAETEV
ncbi:MAG: hypothetical protein HOY76_24360 [Streptomyces sp.]|nr:hypothetical protein [Streptomyces sp.]